MKLSLHPILLLLAKNVTVAVAYCGCDSSCTQEVWNTLATDASGSYTCGGRINWLQSSNPQFYPDEITACIKVSSEEFIYGSCDACDPTKCTSSPTTRVPTSSPSPPIVTHCGCNSCTDDVWNVLATDAAGNYSCGARINWLQTVKANEYPDEASACIKVAAEEFPNGPCGPVCDPTTCNLAVTGSPIQSPTLNPSANPSSTPTRVPSRSPTRAPSMKPSDSPITSSPSPAPSPKPTDDPVSSVTKYCGCDSCTQQVWDTLVMDTAGTYSCGERITWLQTQGYDEVGACVKVAGETFSDGSCTVCDPGKCDDSPKPPVEQKCGGAVNFSNDSIQECQTNLWGPTNDDSMHCFAYGGPSDPCHLNNNNDVDDGLYKNPSMCNGDTFYLWDEPDTQGRDYSWAGREWLAYSQRFADEIRVMKSRGTKVTGPLLKAGESGVLESNMRVFMDACGAACSDESNPAYIDIIAINAFCGPWNDQYGGCRSGASFVNQEATAVSNAFSNIPIYITNWARLQTTSPADQINAIDAVDEFFPSSGDGVVERVYWFGARDFGGGAETSTYLTNVLPDGRTLGELWSSKCDGINESAPNPNPGDYLEEPNEANLVWFDEFDVDGALDSSKWGYDLGDGCPNVCGWGNNEWQQYTSELNNARINNGMLRISAKRDAAGSFTSARVVSRGKFAFRYGRVRIRASVANGKALGTWPALWALPENWVYGGWPRSGEIDIMETVGYETDRFFGSVHTESFNHGIGTEKTGAIIKSKDEFYIFEVDWQENNIRFAIDGKVYYQFTPDDVTDYKQWPFDQEFHILMNIAIGGNWGGATGVDEAAFNGDGQYMEVDWVRVYSN